LKLLFDENLSPELITLLADICVGSLHVRDVGLKSASDSAVWEFAAKQGFTIVSKDGDFRQRSFLRGHPPKTIWIRLGNCSTQDIADLLQYRADDIERFLAAVDQSFLALA